MQFSKQGMAAAMHLGKQDIAVEIGVVGKKAPNLVFLQNIPEAKENVTRWNVMREGIFHRDTVNSDGSLRDRVTVEFHYRIILFGGIPACVGYDPADRNDSLR